jgi:hypothetical protein
MPSGGGGGGGSFAPASPGPIGGTTSNTGQFTNVAVGTSVPTLDGVAGDLTLGGSLATGGNSGAGFTPGDVLIARASGNVGQLLLGGTVAGPKTGIVGGNTSLDLYFNQAIAFQVYNANVRLRALAFSNLPAASTVTGALAAVTDSTTIVWAATITGGGTNNVLAYSNGTNWTVAGH